MQYINSAIYESEFPKELKKAEVAPVFKRGETTVKVNYRPISVLSSVSKCFERILKGQIDRFFKPILSNLLSGFREGYNTAFASKSYRSMEKEPRFVWYSWYDPYGPIKSIRLYSS